MFFFKRVFFLLLILISHIHLKAQVVPVSGNNWTIITTALNGNNVAPCTQTTNYPINLGSNRLLVVAVAVSVNSANDVPTSSVTWGGKSLSFLSTNPASGNRVFAYLFYLKESDIASASGSNLVVTMEGFTIYGFQTFAAVYQNVDQANPLRNGNSLVSTNPPTTSKTASTPTILSGSSIVYLCARSGVNTVYTYKTNKIQYATSYIWSVPVGATLLSAQGDTVIEVSFDSTFTSGNIAVRANSSCGVSAVKSLLVSKGIPSAPSVLSGPSNIYVCTPSGANPVYLYSTRSVLNSISYIWNVPAGVTIISGQGDTTIQVSYDSLFVSGSITVRANSSCGASAAKSLLVIKSIPVAPATLIGVSDVCTIIGNNNGTIYRTNKVSNATSYLWSVPTGANIQSGQGDTAVQVVFTNSFTGGNISVKSVSSCGTNATSKIIAVTKKAPIAPTVIRGTTNVCQAIGSNSIVSYTVNTIVNATSYAWSVPRGATIISGQGDTLINVRYDSSFVSGNISVSALSPCGNSAAKTLAIVKTVPVIPASISGPTSACGYYGNGLIATYTTPSVVNVTSYLWTLPNYVTLISGQGTNTITVKIETGYVTSLIKVKALTACASSADKTLQVTATPYAVPGSISGPTNSCLYINNGTATYTIRKVANAPAYLWTLPTGIDIVSRPGAGGVNDTSITVSYNSDFVFGSSIQVRTTGCTNSSPSSLIISGSMPSVPSTPIGITNVCSYMISDSKPNGDTVTYKIRKVTGALGYIWAVPAEATIVSNPGGAGVNDTIIKVIYSSNFTIGTIDVRSFNSCGNSSAVSLLVSIALPSTPGVISSTLVSSCPNRVYTYKIASMPANATSLLWVVPSGGTIVSGQGTTIIRVSYASTANIDGVISVRGVNNCAISSVKTLAVKIAACTPALDVITKSTSRLMDTLLNNNVAMVSLDKLILNVYPNPSNNEFNVKVNSSIQENIFVKILDVQGRLIKQSIMHEGEIKQIGKELNKGSYFLQIIQGGLMKTVKIVKF